MLENDARRIAAAIEERVKAEGVMAKVESDRTSPSSLPAGAGRPAFIRYYIKIDDGARTAKLDLDQAGALLDDIQPDWDADRLFDVIRSNGVPVEDTP